MRLGWMVQLQNSPTPSQARPARPKWPRQAFPESGRPAVPEGHPGLSSRAPRGRSASRAASSLGRASPPARRGGPRRPRSESGRWAAPRPGGPARPRGLGVRSGVGTTLRATVFGGAGRSLRGSPGNLRAHVEVPTGGCEFEKDSVAANKCS